jgi:CBS domain-containing protein
MNTSLSKLVKKDPVFVAPDVPTRHALEKMVESGVGCMAVAGADEKPVGVLTQSDILKRIVLPGFDLTRPIAEVMTAPPHTLQRQRQRLRRGPRNGHPRRAPHPGGGFRRQAQGCRLRA